MRYCINCGHGLNDKASFCSLCGKAQKNTTVTEMDDNRLNEDEKGEEINLKKRLDKGGTKGEKQPLFCFDRRSTEVKSCSSTPFWQQLLSLKKIAFFCVVIFSLIAFYLIYINVSDSNEINKYKETKNITALSHIVTSDSDYSKRKEAIEALLAIDQPEAMQAVDDLFCSRHSPETEKLLWETLILAKKELPSGIGILSQNTVSNTKLIKEYFLAIESSDNTLRNIKKLICSLTNEEKGYEKITNVINNGSEIIATVNETDKILFKEILIENESWKKEIEDRERLDNEFNALKGKPSASNLVINNNLEKMHQIVMAGYYLKNNIANKYHYADEETKNLMNKVLNDMNHTSKAAIDATANGDVKKMAEIYISIAKDMGQDAFQQVSPLGLQVISEADKLENYNKKIKSMRSELNKMSTRYSIKFELVNTILNNLASEQVQGVHNSTPVTVSEKTYNDEISTILYPQVQIVTNPNTQDIINLRIQNIVNKHIYLGEQIPKYYIGSGKGFIKTYYKIHLNDGKLLSLTFDDHTYFGGAHGRLTRAGLTFDVQTGKLIEWTDIFLPISEKQRQLANQAMSKQVDEKKIRVFPPFSGIKEGVTAPSAFYINENQNPVIIFQPYEVAPFSSGIIEIEVDLSCFENK